MIRDPARSVDVGEWLSAVAEVEPWPGGLAAEVLMRPKDTALDMEFPEVEMAILSDPIHREVARQVVILEKATTI